MRFIVTLAFISACTTSAAVLDYTHDHYILHHDPAHASLVDVADHLGLQIVDRVGALKDMWLARRDPKMIPLEARDTKLEADPVIESYWAMRRHSRRSENVSLAIKHISRQTPRMVTQNAPPPSADRVRREPPRPDPFAIARHLGIKDPSFREQWSLIDPGGYSLNVPQVWAGKKQGYTGKGVLIAVVDDGLKFDHKDLESNFDADHSFDFVENTKQLTVPSGRFYHGTATAGVIAAAKNDLCGVGIAYNSKVAGLRVIGPRGVYDWHEAAALNHAAQNVDIYSSAHGMSTFESPRYSTKQAYLFGINYGRNRKGSIYVTASGNEDSNCNCNGWANSIYTITIGAVERGGRHATYSSPCTAVMAVAYSGSTDYTSKIFSLGIGHDESCSNFYGGTSAAAPAASAIFALALEANPNLTWRDIEYLIVKTSNFVGDEWTMVNGRKYNEKVGFGVLDALAFVSAAKNWRTVPERTWIETVYHQFGEGTMDHNGKFSGGYRLDKKGVSIDVDVTDDMAEEQNFLKIEKVEVKMWVEHQKRGDIEVTLVSPSGTESRLGTRRQEDSAKTGLPGWTFMSVKHWGESPIGTWSLKINDQRQKHGREAKGKLIGFHITFWGCANERGWDKLYEMPADDYDVFPPTNRYIDNAASDDESSEEEGITADYSLDSD